jgi:hypothetical protein
VKNRIALLALLLSVASHTAKSQELEPRSYVNLPIHQTFLAVAAGRAEGDLSPAPGSPLEDASLTVDLGAVALAHTFALTGKSSRVDMTLGRVCYEGVGLWKGERVRADRCEYTDPRIKLTWNFYGAPAMKLKDFVQWQQGLVMGASLMATIPTGTYDSDHLINAGTNRWMIKPGLGVSWRTGRWQWELKGSVSFYEDNDDFFGGNRVERDPLLAMSTHVIYDLRKGRWISVDANYFNGARSTQNGVKSDDKQDNSRFGVTYSFPLNPHHSIKLFFSTGVFTRIGNDFDNFGAAWLYRF